VFLAVIEVDGGDAAIQRARGIAVRQEGRDGQQDLDLKKQKPVEKYKDDKKKTRKGPK